MIPFVFTTLFFFIPKKRMTSVLIKHLATASVSQLKGFTVC